MISINRLTFSKTVKAEQDFFPILPTEWKDELDNHWEKELKHLADVYVLKLDNKIVAGGIVFKNNIPDTENYKDLSQRLFELNLYYLGYIFVKEDCRGLGLSRIWYQQLKTVTPKQAYWLSIEDPNLENMYNKWGFHTIAKMDEMDCKDWVLIEEEAFSKSLIV